jgi:hypothetical protein
MFRRQDPYSYTEYLTLYEGTNTAGMLAIEYRVSLYNDVLVQNQSSATLPQNQQFLFSCTQRLFVINQGNSSVAPVTNSTVQTEFFANYPALIDTDMKIAQQQGVTLNLLDYSPNTVNTAVQQTGSAGTGTGATQSTSSSSTTGSSYTTSNSYGASINIADSFAAVGGNYEHMSASTTDQSSTAGQDFGSSSSADSSNAASMSIKDWGSYGMVNSYYGYPRWIFGQEFPWNAIDCRFATGSTYPGVSDGGSTLSAANKNQYQMIISNAMIASLYDGTYLYPPSELSMFGVNFVMKAGWRIYVDYTASTTITLTHDIDLYTASHIVGTGNVPQVYMDQTPASLTAASGGSGPTFTTTLDLNIMALDPVGVNNKAAIVGFLPAKFIPPVSIVAPATSVALATSFRTLAATNDLLVENATSYGAVPASGFSVSQASLTADWSSTQNIPYVLTLYFKIIDFTREYTLNIKHWLTGATGVQLTLVVNGDASNAITRYVTGMEGEGGDNNLMSIALRDLDFASIDYHDYLQLGLNSIAITVQPIDGNYSAGAGYQIRAMSVVQS